MAAIAVEAPDRPAAATRSRSLPDWLFSVLALAFSLGLTLAVYGSSLQAGIMFDAALDLPRATERSWLEILTSAGASPYFRPLTLLIWKACYELLGRNDFVALHGLSLAAHALCGWLVYELGRRLLDRPAGFAAAALFIWFPLSYQVVGFVDSLFHSLVALWLLTATILYLDARVSVSHWRMAGALVAGALALLTHETAVAVLVPAVGGIEFFVIPNAARNPRLGGGFLATARNDKQRLWPLAFAALTAAFLAIYALIPRWPSPPHLDLPSLQLNVVYFLQALAYPATMLLGHAPRWAIGDIAEVLVVTALVLAALLALAWKRLPAALFGLGWFAFALAVPAVLLPWPNYVIDAPRLLYTASAGIVLLWAAAFAQWRVILLAVVLVESWQFLAIRERLLDQGAAVVRQVMDTATNGGRIYVNLPAFFGPTQPDFLLGHSGVTMLPDYFGLDLEVAAATGQRLPIQSISYDDLARPWSQAYGFQGQHTGPREAAAAVAQGGGVYVARFDESSAVRLDYVGAVANGAATAQATFGDWAAIQEARAEVQGDSLILHITWRALKPAPADFTAFIHVVGDTPQPLAQIDGYPIAGLLPPRDWPAGRLIYDERRLPIPPEAGGRRLRVLIGLYDRAAPATRAQAVDAAGKRLPDDAFSVDVPL